MNYYLRLSLVAVMVTTTLFLLNMKQLKQSTTSTSAAAVSSNSKSTVLTTEFEPPHDDDFARAFALTLKQQDASLYAFDSNFSLPLLRLRSRAESNATWRSHQAAEWLRSSVDVVFAATVRNAMRGLPSTVEQMKRLAVKFRNANFVFVENDSADETRQFLHSWRQRDARVRLLGCGHGSSSGRPCRLNVTYSTGRSHRQGWSMKRTQAERQERGVLMSALRNMYLTYIYQHLSNSSTDSLLIVVDADLTFYPWNLDAILQGLYYFKDRPRLKSLCAHTRHSAYVYDACTLLFHPTHHFSMAPSSRIVAGFRTNAVTGLPPVKVDSCFQAVTAYRLSHLARSQLVYGPADGEILCEHNTLARQLDENYLDFNMRLDIRAQNEGGL